MADYIGQNFYIKPTYIVSLPEFYGPTRGRSSSQRKNESNLKQNSTKGNLSHKSSRKLLNAVNWLVSSSKNKALFSKKHNKYFYFRVNFITLTFPYDGTNCISEKQSKRCIHTFLSYARKYFYLRNYVWKLETTERGQLHTHLTTDTFIDYRKLRKGWNRILSDNNLLDNYRTKYGNSEPNSTDVHAVHKVKDVGAYIAKYMSKSAQTMTEFKGRIWACNREISEANTCKTFIDKISNDVSEKVFNSPVQRIKPIMSPPDAFGKNKEIGQIFFMDEQRWQALQKSIIAETYNAHRFHIRNNIEPMPPEYWNGFVNDFFGDKLKFHDTEKIHTQIALPTENIRIPYRQSRIRKGKNHVLQDEFTFA